MAIKTLQEQLIDKAQEIDERYREVLDERAANRRTLRDLLAQGMLSDEQAEYVEEKYPERKRGERDDDVEGDE